MPVLLLLQLQHAVWLYRNNTNPTRISVGVHWHSPCCRYIRTGKVAHELGLYGTYTTVSTSSLTLLHLTHP
jgi:fluoride ion exporter CrcB/FEX